MAQDTAHTCTRRTRGTGKNQHPMGRKHWGDPADPPGGQQRRYPKATGPSPARLHRDHGKRHLEPWKQPLTGEPVHSPIGGRLLSREASQLKTQG